MYKRQDEEGIFTILEKQDHKIQRFFRKLKFKIPMYKRTSLDEYGSCLLYTSYNREGKNVAKTIRVVDKNGNTILEQDAKDEFTINTKDLSCCLLYTSRCV